MKLKTNSGSRQNEVSSQIIGEYVMNLLAKVDEIAYIRFASVYRQFKDMNVFMSELKDMMAKDKATKRKLPKR